MHVYPFGKLNMLSLEVFSSSLLSTRRKILLTEIFFCWEARFHLAGKGLFERNIPPNGNQALLYTGRNFPRGIKISWRCKWCILKRRKPKIELASYSGKHEAEISATEKLKWFLLFCHEDITLNASSKFFCACIWMESGSAKGTPWME